MKLHRHGSELLDEHGRRVAWLGFGKKACSMRLSYEEHEEVLRWIDHALYVNHHTSVKYKDGQS